MMLHSIRSSYSGRPLLVVDGMLGYDGYVGNTMNEVDVVVVVLRVVDAESEMVRICSTQSIYGKKWLVVAVLLLFRRKLSLLRRML